MFEIDSFQERYLDDEDDKRWLIKVLRDLGDTQFPLLKENMEKNKANISFLLDQVLKEAESYDFLDDDLLLVRYAIYALNNNHTAMEVPDFKKTVEKAESIKIGIMDQIAYADWGLRMHNLFNRQVFGVV